MIPGSGVICSGQGTGKGTRPAFHFRVSCLYGPLCTNTANEAVQNSRMTMMTLTHLVKSKSLTLLCKAVSHIQFPCLEWHLASLQMRQLKGQHVKECAQDCPDCKRQDYHLLIWGAEPWIPRHSNPFYVLLQK